MRYRKQTLPQERGEARARAAPSSCGARPSAAGPRGSERPGLVGGGPAMARTALHEL